MLKKCLELLSKRLKKFSIAPKLLHYLNLVNPIFIITKKLRSQKNKVLSVMIDNKQDLQNLNSVGRWSELN